MYSCILSFPLEWKKGFALNSLTPTELNFKTISWSTLGQAFRGSPCKCYLFVCTKASPCLWIWISKYENLFTTAQLALNDLEFSPKKLIFSQIFTDTSKNVLWKHGLKTALSKC